MQVQVRLLPDGSGWSSMPSSWRALEAISGGDGPGVLPETAPRQGAAEAEAEVPVILADSGRLFREGLAFLLSGQPGISVLAHAGTAREMLSALSTHPSAIVLMGCHLPRAACLEAAKELRGAKEGVRIVLLVSAQDPAFLGRAARAGVHGVVSDAVQGQELGVLLRSLHRGEDVISPYYVPLQGEGAQAARMPGNERRGLTRQERRVLARVTEGRTNREIARSLGISQDTVKAHLKSIFGKLEAKSRTEAAVLGMRWGLLDEPSFPERGTNGQARSPGERSRTGSGPS